MLNDHAAFNAILELCMVGVKARTKGGRPHSVRQLMSDPLDFEALVCKVLLDASKREHLDWYNATTQEVKDELYQEMRARLGL